MDRERGGAAELLEPLEERAGVASPLRSLREDGRRQLARVSYSSAPRTFRGRLQHGRAQPARSRRRGRRAARRGTWGRGRRARWPAPPRRAAPSLGGAASAHLARTRRSSHCIALRRRLEAAGHLLSGDRPRLDGEGTTRAAPSRGGAAAPRAAPSHPRQIWCKTLSPPRRARAPDRKLPRRLREGSEKAPGRSAF